MKRHLLACTVLLCASSLLFTAEKPMRGDKRVTVQMPPVTAFISLKRQLKDVNWKDLIYTNELKPNKDVVGYQIGILFANWSVAAAIRDEKAVTIISTNLIRLTRDIDIDDDTVLVNVKKRVQKFGDYFKDDTPESYRAIQTNIDYIRDEIKRYYSKSGNKVIVDQIGFGAWLEFLYIGANGLILKYEPSVTAVFNRGQEIDSFIEKFSANSKLGNVVGFLRGIKPKMTLKEGATLSKTELIALREQIKAFRAKLLAVK